MCVIKFIIAVVVVLATMSSAFQIQSNRGGLSLRMALADYRQELAKTASTIAAPGKGILAVDESTKTIGKRLESIGVENTEANRKAYRGMLFTAPGLGKYISGAILYEETLFQSGADGNPFVQTLNKNGVYAGIKVDTGLQPLLGGHPCETWCGGLDGLKDRAASYYAQGARFCKWRAVLQITEDGAPTPLSIQENAWGLARYARTCQDAGLVPIVEPEILMDGDHTIETTAAVQEKVLAAVYKALSDNGVFLEGTLLKPSMTVPGAGCTAPVTKEKIAEFTIRTLERCVPSAVPGITFLSGGLSEEEASVYLNTMNSFKRKGPWSVTFSYGRALQQSALKSWGGKAENVGKAQAALLARAQANSEANLGKYVAGSQPSADGTLFVKGYVY